MRFTLAVCASLVLSACAATPDQGGATDPAATSAPVSSTAPARLPFDPFAKGAADDWSLFTVRDCTFEDDRLARAGKGVLLFKLVAPTPGDGEVELHVRDDWRGLDTTTTFLVDELERRSGSMNVVVGPRGVAPTLRDYLYGLLRESIFSDAVWSEVDARQETYTTAQPQEFADRGPGRTFQCTRLAFSVVHGDEVARVVLWVSPDARGTGLVALRLQHLTGPGAHKTELVDLELFGHGTAAEALFGTPKELVFTDE